MSALLRGLPPVIGRDTRLIVLGSFPGVASLAAGQYYAHARNQFWPLLGALLGEPLAALPYEQRLRRLQRRGVGLWDVIGACRREGSLDSGIRDAVYNDLARLLERAPALRALAHNGAASARAMRVTATLGVAVYRLPSSSPANARLGFERKLELWREVFAACGLLPSAIVPLPRP